MSHVCIIIFKYIIVWRHALKINKSIFIELIVTKLNFIYWINIKINKNKLMNLITVIKSAEYYL